MEPVVTFPFAGDNRDFARGEAFAATAGFTDSSTGTTASGEAGSVVHSSGHERGPRRSELLAHAQALRAAHIFLAVFMPNCHVPFVTFPEHANLLTFVEDASVDENNVRFMTQLEWSGLGEETCLLPAHHYIPPYRNMEASRAAVELVIFSAIEEHGG